MLMVIRISKIELDENHTSARSLFPPNFLKSSYKHTLKGY